MSAQTTPDADAQRDDAPAKNKEERIQLRGLRSAPHPLARMAERLGRSPGRRPLPDVFEQYLLDQLTRVRVAPPARSALIPSRDLLRAHRRRRTPARRPDA
jgi:hypothetical protein